MAYFSGTIKSKSLDMDTNLHVLLPYDTPSEQMKTPAKVLYLLHGQGSNSSSWMRWTSIARYAQKKGIAVIMPEVQRTFYLDMKYGLNYNTYVAKELPQLVQSMFQISGKREDTFIAGLSMGGYGAMRIGFDNPKQYAGVASLSGLCDISAFQKVKDQLEPGQIGELIAVLGEDLPIEPKNDIYYLAEQVSNLPENKQPKIYTCCGKQDELFGLYEQNKQFAQFMNKLPLAQYEYEEWDGVHDYNFWDQAIVKVLDYFF